MNYREEIFHYLFENTEEVWHEWIQSHPPLEQVDILLEVKAMIEDVTEDMECEELANALKRLEEKANQYQDAILDEKLLQLQMELAEADEAAILSTLEHVLEGVRIRALDCICANGPNAELMKQQAIRMMKHEKDLGIHDPEKWWPLSLDEDA